MFLLGGHWSLGNIFREQFCLGMAMFNLNNPFLLLLNLLQLLNHTRLLRLLFNDLTHHIINTILHLFHLLSTLLLNLLRSLLSCVPEPTVVINCDILLILDSLTQSGRVTPALSALL